MSKLTQSQKEHLKRCVTDSTIRRLTTVEMQQYVKEKMGVDISIDYLWHVKSDIKKDSIGQLQAYQKDKVSFLTEIFLSPTDELKLLKGKLHHIIETEKNNEIIIKAIDQLQSVNSQLTDYYALLPQVAGVRIDTALSSIIDDHNNIGGYSSSNSNNSATQNTATTMENNNTKKTYFCPACQKYHDGKFGDNCAAYQC